MKWLCRSAAVFRRNKKNMEKNTSSMVISKCVRSKNKVRTANMRRENNIMKIKKA
jgi:hypothetical protein